MNNLSHFLANEPSGFGAELGHKGGYIKFSNSGKRGGTKSFHISLEALAETLQNIRDHINEFAPLQDYVEKSWRDSGAKFFTNDVANATITVQTKPLFSTLSKLIKWANPDKYIGRSTDSEIVLTEETLSKTLQDLASVIDSYTPKSSSTEKTSSRQTIFFGTPGSGKSYKVKDITEGKKVHRTTFHPDSDYASFVGCYKPTMRSSVQEDLSLEELVQRLPEVQDESYLVHKFVIKYYHSIRKLQPSDQKKLLEKIREAKGKGRGKKDKKNEEADKEYEDGLVYTLNDALAFREYLEQEKLLGDSSEISYSFTPQVFTEAYVDAWTHPEEVVYLVIEEINRGNCAQIFGDLFQLLDRNSEGKSDYRIKADSDLRDYLYSRLGEGHEGIKGGELCLPSNLHILATMNTSDQSLFPMDSAFKRRWDWEYVPVDYECESSSRFIIILEWEENERKYREEYRWVDFLKAVNERIRKATDSEDKQMGNFFIKSDIGEAEFKSKVMFYLWNEVCRDEYGTSNNFFRISQDPKATEQDAKEAKKDVKEAKQFSFNDLYQGSEEDRLEKLRGFMRYLGVSPSSSTTGDTEQKAGDSAEEAQDRENTI